MITKHVLCAFGQRWIWAKNSRTLICNLHENSMESHSVAWGRHVLMKNIRQPQTWLLSNSQRNYPQSSILSINRIYKIYKSTGAHNPSKLIISYQWVKTLYRNSVCVSVCACPNVTVILQYDEGEAITVPYCCPVKRAIRWQRQIDRQGTARMSDGKKCGMEEYSD